jgi:hypothetical protein
VGIRAWRSRAGEAEERSGAPGRHDGRHRAPGGVGSVGRASAGDNAPAWIQVTVKIANSLIRPAAWVRLASARANLHPVELVTQAGCSGSFGFRTQQSAPRPSLHRGRTRGRSLPGARNSGKETLLRRLCYSRHWYWGAEQVGTNPQAEIELRIEIAAAGATLGGGEIGILFAGARVDEL